MKGPILKCMLFILGLCSPSLFVSAQCPDSAELNITATLYTQENGLTSNWLSAIARDSVGYRYFLGVDENWIRCERT